MNAFEMVVLIVFLAVAGSVVNNMLRAFGHRKEAGRASAGEADELRDQMLTLEDRIRVLERIVTDTSNREDLKRQFRDLES